jgi:hypothetical protein
MHTEFWSENLKGRAHFGNFGVDGIEDVQCIHLDQDRAHWRTLSEHNNKPSDTNNFGEFLDQLRSKELVKLHSVGYMIHCFVYFK